MFRATCKQTDGGFILFGQTSQQGKTTPVHGHSEDEAFYVLDGELVVHIDGTDHPGKPGSIIVVPLQTPHAFRAKPVRTGSERQAIQPPAHELPEPGPPDLARLGAASQQYGVEILARRLSRPPRNTLENRQTDRLP